MNSRRNFLENNERSFYSGRKIRGLRTNIQQEEVSNNAPQSIRVEQPMQQVQDTVRSHETVEFHFKNVATANVQVDESVTKLVRSLENKLSRQAQSNLIGVFGINSDNTIREALQVVQKSGRRDIVMLQQSRLIDNAFTMFAAAIFEFIKLNFRDRYSYSYSSAKINMMLDYLYKIQNDEPLDYDSDIEQLNILGRKLDRGKNCNELIAFIKQQEGWHNTKFIWNIN